MDQKFKDNLVIAILATTMSASAALVPVLSSISKVFVQYKDYIHLLITIPPLMIMLSSMLVGPLLKFLSSKEISLLGLVLIIFSGVYPYFSNSFILLLISRVIMGLGLGLITTISSSLPARYFKSGQDRDRATGLQSAFSSLGGVLFSFLSGFIASYYWKGVFLVQLLNIIPLLVVLAFMKPNFQDLDQLEEVQESSRSFFIKDALLITFLAFLAVVINATFPLNLSLYIDERSLGTTSLAGLIASLNAFIGFLIGIMFPRINKALRGYSLSLALLITGLSFFMASQATSSLGFLIGSSFFGIGTSLIYPGFLTIMYKQIEDRDIVPAMGMYTVAVNIAQFVSPFIINNLSRILGPGLEARFLFSGLAISLLAGFSFLIIKRNDFCKSI